MMGTNGVWKTCPICGKPFFVANSDDWSYKRSDKKGLHYFHTWSCLRQYDKQHSDEIHEKRVKAAMARHAAKPKVVIKTRTSMRYCGKCGKRVTLDDEFCANCGTVIDWSDYTKGAKA